MPKNRKYIHTKTFEKHLVRCKVLGVETRNICPNAKQVSSYQNYPEIVQRTSKRVVYTLRGFITHS